MKNCPNCGIYINNNEATFCSNCGQNINTLNNNEVASLNIDNLSSNNSSINDMSNQTTIDNLYNVQTNNIMNNVGDGQLNSLNNNDLKEKKNTFNKKIIIIIISILILALAIGLFLMLSPKKTENKSKTADKIQKEANGKIENPEAFFLSNDDGIYAIFDENGDRLTDFIYSYPLTMSGNESITDGVLVENLEQDLNIIIDKNGKEILSFSKDSYVAVYGNLIFNSKEKGTIGDLYNLSGKKVLSDINENSLYSMYGSGEKFAIIVNSNEYNILNSEGEIKYSFTIDEGKEANIKRQGDFLEIYYYNINNEMTYYIYNLKEEVVIYENLSVPSGFEIEVKNDDYSKIIFMRLDKFVFYENGKKTLEGEPKECTPILQNGKLICDDYFGESYFFDEYGNVDTSVGFDEFEIINENDYAIYNKSQDTTYVYVNNELVKTIPEWELGGSNKNYYIIENYGKPWNRSAIIDKNGNVKGDIDFINNGFVIGDEYASTVTMKEIDLYAERYATLYDSTGNALEIPKFEKNFFSSIEGYDDEYIMGSLHLEEEDKNINVIMDHSGKIIFEGEWIVTYSRIHEVASKYDIVCSQNSSEDEYESFNLTLNKTFAITSEKPYFAKYYAQVELDDKTEYYSYTTGKLFHTKKNN